MTQLSIHIPVHGKTKATACDLLATDSGLSKTKIKDAMTKGAAWVQPSAGPRRRLRRATARLKPGHVLHLYYDDDVLSRKPADARCVSDQAQYSIWHKCAGLLTQGTRYGDHCALTRRVELYFENRRPVFIVHRLDREVSGLVILAHTKTAAAHLSRLFREQRIRKIYHAEVKGNLAARSTSGEINLPLDGKPALTAYEVLHYHSLTNTTTIEILLKTGRRHQIRRHFDHIEFPVMGDPRYAMDNKNTTGLRLWAVGLEFTCPFSAKRLRFQSDHFHMGHEES